MNASKKKVPEQKKAVESLQKLVEDYLSGWQRCKADFENYKKQQSEWANNFRLLANEDIIQEIIPVIDNFELALAHLPKNPEVKVWSEGIAYIKRQLEEILSKNNVRRIEAKSGDLFDPRLHEGVLEKECQARPDDLAGRDSKNQKNNFIVKEVVRNGYILGEKILRPAKVTLTAKNEKSDQ